MTSDTAAVALADPPGVAADEPDALVEQAEVAQHVVAHTGVRAADASRSEPGNGCTPAQMRRFIKSRPWVPMHELRRRFAINGAEDEVTTVDVAEQRIWVGLPEREGRMLGELLRGGDVGYELSLDPTTPIVVGVYPMRPVPRT